MKKLFLFSILVVLLSFNVIALESSVSRSFSSMDIIGLETIDVTLNVTILNNEDSYAIEEYLPSDWIIIDADGGETVNSNILKWVVTENAIDTTYTYTVKAPNIGGEHNFNGNYMFEGMNNSLITNGETIVSVDAPEPDPVEFDIAYLIRNSGDIDPVIVNAINEIGFTIAFIDDSDLSKTDFSKYRLILVPDKNFDSFVNHIPVNNVKSLILNTYHMDEFNWISGSVSQTGGSQPLRANVVDSQIKITDSIPSNFQVYTSAKDNGVSIPMSYLAKEKKALEVEGVVGTENDLLDSVVAKTEIGTSLKNGKVANARGVFFGITKTEFWTTDTKKIFQNSIAWLVSGEDRDGDSYFTDDDCNDNDANINPSAIDIPYDGIDQDCSGSDLNDLDLDTYIAHQAGGDDCDDSDSSINPGSPDSTKNCANEAPIFSGPISNLTWDEDSFSEIINLKSYFTDPDLDDLNFIVYDTSTNENVTVIFLTSELVRFESDENWNGEDWIIFGANDSEIITPTNRINLTINPVNDAPIIDEIDNIIINETDLIGFKISATDPEGDDITISLEGDMFTHLGNNTYEWQTTYNDSGLYHVTAIANDSELQDIQLIEIFVNNLNRIPIVEDILNQTIEEDNEISLLINAVDPDEEDLTYKIITENVTHVNCEVNENNLTIIPYLNYNGLSNCEVEISDSEAKVIKSFNITVTPVNDAPVIEHINDITSNENELVEVRVVATDPDEDSLTYSIDDNRFLNDGYGNFSWQTTYSDEGSYEVEINVTDGLETTSQKVLITIEDKNQPPIIDPINNITIEEDSEFTLFENVLSAQDFDGYISRFKVGSEDKNKVDCEVSGVDLGVTPAKDFEGEAACLIRAYDDDFDYSETLVMIIVTNINDAPRITSYVPEFNPVVTEDGEYAFSINYVDLDTIEKNVVVRWYVEDLLEGVGKAFTFVGDGRVRNFNIKAIVDDQELNDSVEWTLTTTNLPIANSYDGASTNFIGMNEIELSNVNLILEKSEFGKIEFLDSVDLTDVANLDLYSDILKGILAIDSETYSAFKNKKAKITFYNLNYEKTPTIYYESGFNLNPSDISVVCPESICTNVEYVNNELSFVVNGFSTFMAGDTLMCSESSGYICSESEVCKADFIEARDSNACCPIECTPAFDDITTCELIENNIEITIKDPDENDEFEISDTIDIEVRIKNNFDEDLDFDIEASLYDLDEDESIEEVDDDIEVDEGDSEKVELEIEIPEDIEDNNFAVHVYVQDEEDRCTSDFVNIDIERKKHEVIIQDVTFTPQIVAPGDNLKVDVRIENIGSNDEDVVVSIENTELEIMEISEEFEIEEFNNDDKERVNFFIKIPENIEEKKYSLKAIVTFDDGDEKNTLTIPLSVVNGLSMSQSNSLAKTMPVILLNSKVGSENLERAPLSNELETKEDNSEFSNNKEETTVSDMKDMTGFVKAFTIVSLISMFVIIFVGVGIIIFSNKNYQVKLKHIYSKIYNRVYKSL